MTDTLTTLREMLNDYRSSAMSLDVDIMALEEIGGKNFGLYELREEAGRQVAALEVAIKAIEENAKLKESLRSRSLGGYGIAWADVD